MSTLLIDTPSTDTDADTDLKRLLAAVPPGGHVPADAADEVRDQRVELLGREELWTAARARVCVCVCVCVCVSC